MSKNKNNIINIPSFQSKNKKAFIGKCKPYKCYNHYYKYTQNTYLTIKFTFKYIFMVLFIQPTGDPGGITVKGEQ